MRQFLTGLALVAALALAGCSAPSRQSVMDKAKDITSKAELEKALGKPSEVRGQVGIPGVASTETWVYKTSDGEVLFQIVGDKVMLQVTGEKK
jgi:uncharacterized lipoprotein YmbA